MKSQINRRSASPVILRLDRNQLTEGMRVFLWTIILITLGSACMFIWLLMRAYALHDMRAILMASSVIIGVTGVLYYYLAGVYYPKRAKAFFSLAMPIAIGLLIASVYVN